MNNKKLYVGLISMQRVFNYGSFLQAFALKRMLEATIVEVFFIDIKPGNKIISKNAIHNNSIFTKLLKLTPIFKIPFYIKRHNFQKKFNEKFIHNYFPILDLDKRQPKFFDFIVIGSDEVFNIIQPSSWGFSTQLFGQNLNANKIFSYAASFGYTTYDNIVKYNLLNNLKDAIINFNMISVRDDNSANIIEKITGVRPPIHLDPVLVYDFKNLITEQRIEKNDYIIIYAKRISVEEAKVIKLFATTHNKKLISIQCYYQWCDKAVIPETPFDVLNYCKYADYIVTDTYHGTIFSIIYNKQFCTFVRSSNYFKITHLLEKLNLTSQRVEYLNLIEKILNNRIDYDEVNKILEVEKGRTLAYFENFR